MKVLSIAVLALALCPGIDASDTPHGTPRREEKGRVRVGQREGSRERGYADVEEESVKTRSGLESRGIPPKQYFKMKSILCMQASDSSDPEVIASMMSAFVGLGCTALSCIGAFCGPAGACLAWSLSIGAAGQVYNEGQDEPNLSIGEVRTYSDELILELNGHKVYPRDNSVLEINSGEFHLVPIQDQPIMELGNQETFCLKEVDTWGDDDLGCVTLKPSSFNTNEGAKHDGGVVALTSKDNGSSYIIDFDLVTVSATTPLVGISKIDCHEVEDAGWWEDDEIALFLNGQKVWPDSHSIYEITDGESYSFNWDQMRAYGGPISQNPEFCLWDFDGSSKDTKLGCKKFHNSQNQVNCDDDPNYLKTEWVQWRAGGGHYSVQFKTFCP